MSWPEIRLGSKLTFSLGFLTFLAFDGKGTLMRVSQCAIRLIITLDVFAHYFSSMENYL